MSYKLYIFQNLILLFLFPSFSFAESFFDASISSVMDYRKEELRTQANSSEASVRNLSLRISKKTETNGYLIEFLMDRDLSTEGSELSLGELYYTHNLKNKYAAPDLKLGIMKLNYGILNNIDENFYVLPSYYKFLYGLPRGLDIGAFVDNKIWDSNFYFGVGAYVGRSVRDSDQLNQDPVGVPFNFRAGYKFNEKNNIYAHYFIREYAGSPRTRGAGLSYDFYYQMNSWGFKFTGEYFNLNSNIGSNTSNANAFLFSPKIDFKGVYVNPIFSFENWKNNNTLKQSESYNSLRLGWAINKNIQIEAERLQIKDREEEFYKENSYVVRVFMNWDF